MTVLVSGRLMLAAILQLDACELVLQVEDGVKGEGESRAKRAVCLSRTGSLGRHSMFDIRS